VQEPLARAVARGVVLERDAAEACEGVADVRGVVDRQPSASFAVDVGERSIGEVRSLAGGELCHAPTIPPAADT
jgi:hypothetical protein